MIPTSKICVTSKILKKVIEEDGSKYLFNIRVFGVEKQIVYIQRGEEADFEIVDGPLDYVNVFFERLRIQDISPIHLADLTDDYKMQLKMEIF